MLEFSQSIGAIASALHTAQGDVSGAVKDARNPHFKKSYATLESVIEAVKPALQKAGIAFLQAPGRVTESGAVEITTMLVHSSGEWLRSTLHVPLSKKDPQGVGSAITYGCRYSLMAMLGIPPVDDDGEGAMDRDHRRAESKPKDTPKAKSGSAEYMSLAREAIFAADASDLKQWWIDEERTRINLGIIKGTDEFDELVFLCQQKKEAA